jgi:hypothetical protein
LLLSTFGPQERECQMKFFMVCDTRRPSQLPKFAANKKAATELARVIGGLDGNRKSKFVTVTAVECEKGRAGILAAINAIFDTPSARIAAACAA